MNQIITYRVASGGRLARGVRSPLAARRRRRRHHARGLPAAGRPGRRLARQSAARGRALRLPVRRAGLLAVLQFAAHRHHGHVRHLAADRRVARRDRRRRHDALRRARGGHGAAGGAASPSSPGWRKPGAIVNFISESVHDRLQVRRGAVPRQHATAEAVRRSRRARRASGRTAATSSSTWTKPTRASLDHRAAPRWRCSCSARCS